MSSDTFKYINKIIYEISEFLIVSYCVMRLNMCFCFLCLTKLIVFACHVTCDFLVNSVVSIFGVSRHVYDKLTKKKSRLRHTSI